MKIGVCIKPVPSSDARISLAGSGNGVDASVYSKLMLNAYDECALEAAVLLQEQGVATEVVVFTVMKADKNVNDQLITALAKGADRVVMIDEDMQNTDCLGVSKVLTAMAKKEGVEALFCGKQSMDGDNSQVPSMMAELLGWSSVISVSEFTVEGSEFTAHKDIAAGAKAVVKGGFPAVFSCDKNLNKPRNPNLKAKMAAKKKPIDSLSLGDVELSTDDLAALVTEVNWSLPPQREECKFIDASNVETAVTELLSLLKNEAKVL